MKKYKKYLPWFFVLLWMLLIFLLSAQPATDSNSLSTVITKKIEVLVENVTNIQLNIEDFNHIVRKAAHFTAYLILGILISIAFSTSIKNRKIQVKIMIICILYASSDEFHQLFVPGRGSSVIDVMIDTSGALIGILLYMLIIRIVRKRKYYL